MLEAYGSRLREAASSSEERVHEELCCLLRWIDGLGEENEAKVRELDALVGEHARDLLRYASLSSRCFDVVTALMARVVEFCSNREVHTLVTDVLRDVVSNEEEEEEEEEEEKKKKTDSDLKSLSCVVSTLSAALRGIARKKHLFVLSSSALSLKVCRKAAKAFHCLAEGEGRGKEGKKGRCEDDHVVRRASGIILKVIEDASLAIEEYGKATNANGQREEKSTKSVSRKLKFLCLRLLGSVHPAITAGAEEEDWKVWQELTVRALHALGDTGLDSFTFDESEGVTDEESSDEEYCTVRRQILGSSIVVEKLLDEGSGASSCSSSVPALRLMRMASFYFGKLLEYAETDSNPPAALSKAMHLLYVIMSNIESKGGLNEASTYQDEIFSYLMRIMSHFPDRSLRVKARFCLLSVLSALGNGQRCQALARLLETCEYPSIRSSLLSAMKDEVAAAWSEKSRTGRESSFLSRPAISCLLGPLYHLEEMSAPQEKSEYFLENSDAVLASLNALRYLLLREHKEDQPFTFLLDPEHLSTLLVKVIPCIENLVGGALEEHRAANKCFKYSEGKAWVGGESSRSSGICSTGLCTCSIEDEWGKRVFMNILAIENVTNRNKEILQDYKI